MPIDPNVAYAVIHDPDHPAAAEVFLMADSVDVADVASVAAVEAVARYRNGANPAEAARVLTMAASCFLRMVAWDVDGDTGRLECIADILDDVALHLPGSDITTEA